MITGLILYPYFLTVLRGPNKYNKAIKAKRIWSRLLSSLCFIKVKLHGTENFPIDKNYIVCANHASYLDIILMFQVIPNDFAFLGKSEVLKWPIISIFFRKGIDIPVYRNNRKKATESIQLSKQALLQNRNLAIFPEGTMPENPPNMSHFKNGAFTLALEHKVPIVPITFANNYKRFTDHLHFFGPGSPGKVDVYIHPPINVDDRTELVALRQLTFDIIKSKIEL